MSMDYIRRTYKVPAMVGGRVEYTGGVGIERGVITGTNGQYLRVRLDGKKSSSNFHPTWAMKYLSGTYGVMG